MFEVNNVKALLSIKGDSIEELMKLLNKSRASISQKINDKRKWTYKEMQLLREHYDLTDEQFINIFFK